ncbi:MAG: hypothetical protein ABUL55_02615 [Pseudomonadota bacterium]
MKLKTLAGAALAALTLGAALPAAADDYNRGAPQSQRSDRGYDQNAQRPDSNDNRGDYDRGGDDRDAYNRGDDRNDRRGGDWGRGRGVITVESRDFRFTVDRGDRLYRTLIRDYGFRPGLTYHYTDRCNRAGCAVLVFDGLDRRPVDRMFAPRLGYGADWRTAGRPVNTHDWRDRDDRYRNWNNR